MVLSTSEILREMKRGNIVVDPFDMSRINPNSVNLRLHNELFMMREGLLDMKAECEYDRVVIPEEGFVLQPNRLYLGRTLEYTVTKKQVPLIEGRSSIGRMGIFIHATAGFGDVGFAGYWTLEISVIQPVKIYPFVEIAQIYYNTVKGKAMQYKGKYQNNRGIQTSGIHRELSKSE
jgi:dCTP deaminase